MLDMLKARKEQLEAQGKKGFTLMEMLIVIAIIAVLIAIAIPIFTSQLDNAKRSADEANARSIYAMVMADYMDNNTYNETNGASSQSFTSNNGDKTITINGQDFKFSNLATALDIAQPANGAPTVTLTESGVTNSIQFGGTTTSSSTGTGTGTGNN